MRNHRRLPLDAYAGHQVGGIDSVGLSRRLYCQRLSHEFVSGRFSHCDNSVSVVWCNAPRAKLRPIPFAKPHSFLELVFSDVCRAALKPVAHRKEDAISTTSLTAMRIVPPASKTKPGGRCRPSGLRNGTFLGQCPNAPATILLQPHQLTSKSRSQLNP
jgi:hypothetical protein